MYFRKNNGEDICIINIADFGADSFGYEDSGKAFIKVFEYIKEVNKNFNKIILNMDKGIYRITKSNAIEKVIHISNTDSIKYPNKKIGILIDNIDNLTIEGNNSEILFEGDMMSIGIIQSKNIMINDLSIDFKMPTTTEMTIFDYDYKRHTIDYFIPNYMTYEIIDNHIRWFIKDSNENIEYWCELDAHKNYAIPVKYSSHMISRNYYSNQSPFEDVTSITKLDNGLVRFTYKSMSKISPEIGMVYELVSNSVRPTAGALISESMNVKLNNVRITYMNGFGFLVQMSENIYFDKLKMLNLPNTGKFTTSYADGIHVSGAKGKIEITNSIFNNTHDDPINIHGTFVRVENIIDERTLKLRYIHEQQGGFKQFYPGDKVLFYSRKDLTSSDNETYYTVENVIGPNEDDLKSMIVCFREILPKYLEEKLYRDNGKVEGKYVAENVTYTPDVLIKGNKFINVFTRSILVTSREKIVIENNLFKPSTMATLFFSNDSDNWYESGPIRDLTIRNNIFYVDSIGRTWWKYAPAIYFYPVTFQKGKNDISKTIHKNINIENNIFYLGSDGALRAENVENFRFVNNQLFKIKASLEKNILEIPNGPENSNGSNKNLLEFQNSKNIIIKDNIYNDNLKPNVLFEGMMSKDYIVNDKMNIITQRKNNEDKGDIKKNNIFSAKILSVNTDLGNFEKIEDVIYIKTQTDNRFINIDIKVNENTSKIIVENEDQFLTYNSKNNKFILPIYNGVNTYKITAYNKMNKIDHVIRLMILRHRNLLKGIKSISIASKFYDINNNYIDLKNEYNINDIEIIPNDINAKLDHNIIKKDENYYLIVRIRHEDGLSFEYFRYVIINYGVNQ